MASRRLGVRRMRRLGVGRIGVVCLLATFLSGCHTYHQVDNPPVGSMVRVRVPVTSAIAGRNAPVESASIEGMLVAADDTLTLATETRREFGAYRELMQRDTLRLARSQASSVEVREFSTKRSVVLGVVIAGVAGVSAWYAFDLGGGGDPPGGNGGEPPALSVVTPSLLSALWGLIAR